MRESLGWLERAARAAHLLVEAEPPPVAAAHPFAVRNIHANLPSQVRKLFDNGHYPQATFEAFKYLDNLIKKLGGSEKMGAALMMEAFRPINPAVQLTPLSDETERVEQEGYKFIFAGSMMAIRNPRGHEHDVEDDMDTCLDHLGLASQLLRRLEHAGYDISR